ncbi:MAG TPA: c-type cytochrome [Vicinamibacterales bacterium]|nr:c-type cytochrome [Vicinamibacterales bacterium]
MSKFGVCMVAAGLWFGVVASGAVLADARAQAQEHAHKHDDKGWTIPEGASEEANPLRNDASAVETGRQLFRQKCQRCHGPGGLGDGPDADPDHQDDMNLTRADRAEANPDGVVFYKAWNGRSKPKMPAFRDDLTKEQVWAIVTYVQTLRGK